MHSSHFYVIILSIHSVAVVRINLIHSITSQSRPFVNHNSSLAIDGNQETCSITDPEPELAENSWWLLELDTLYNITDVKIFVASDLYGDFIKNLKIYAAKTQGSLRHSLCATFIKANYDPTGYNNITCKNPHFVKFIMIERFRGPLRNMLVLCEVRLYAALNTVNLALHRPTEQSGVFFQKTSHYSVDGKLDTCTIVRSFSKEFAWWRVILDDSYYVTNVIIYFLANSTGRFAKKHVYVYVSNDEDRHETHICGNTEYPHDRVGERGAINITCERPFLASSVTIRKFTGARPRWMVLCDVHVYSKGEPQEFNVSIVGNCSEHEYRCFEERCIHNDFLCDGTEDCPQGDDEAQSCRSKCAQYQFKCLRRNVCIYKIRRCDGIVHCPDYSDEQNCFQIESNTDLLKATYKGQSDHYICSRGWKPRQSFDVCAKHGRHYSDTSIVPITNQMHKFLIKMKSHEEDEPLMRYFEASTHCESGKVIKVHCDLSRINDTETMCGTRGLPDADFRPYIIKGLKSKYGAWPWQAQVFVNSHYVCGGSIIKENLILTSAHCFDEHFSSIHVMVDTIIRDDPSGNKLPASHLVIHPKFDNKASASPHDIALIRLKSPIIYSKNVRPVCLPRGALDLEMLTSYRYCLTTGFGLMDRNGSSPKYLQEGRINILSDENCLDELSDLGSRPPSFFVHFISPEKFCAGSSPTVEGINICKGDSGGPYVCKNDRRIWTIIGIATTGISRSYSYGSPRLRCALSIFTKVDRYLDFIYQVFQLIIDVGGACMKPLFHLSTYFVIICYIAIFN